MKWPLIVVGTWVPIQGLQSIAADLAGKNTQFSMGFTVSLAFNLVGVATIAALVRNVRSKRGDLVRQRETITKLQISAGLGAQLPEEEGDES